MRMGEGDRISTRKVFNPINERSGGRIERSILRDGLSLDIEISFVSVVYYRISVNYYDYPAAAGGILAKVPVP